jgi:hypothetical protein
MADSGMDTGDVGLAVVRACPVVSFSALMGVRAWSSLSFGSAIVAVGWGVCAMVTRSFANA